MNSQNNGDDSMNFSVIDKKQDANPSLDFSVQSILEQQLPLQSKIPYESNALQQSVDQVFSKIRAMKTPSGASIMRPEIVQAKGEKPREGATFLKDLERMQKQLSFESESYNIYDQNPNCSNEVVQNNKSKTLSCLKVTKQTNKTTNKSINQQLNTYYNEYYGPLVVDFKKEPKHQHNHQNKKSIKKDLKTRTKTYKNDTKSNSQISNQFSKGSTKGSKPSQTERSKSRSKDSLRTVFGIRQKSHRDRDNLVVNAFKKSKSRSHYSKVDSQSKSHSNLKTSCEVDNYASKVFTQYYGTDINITGRPTELKHKKQSLLNIKSRQKSSKSKSKLGLLSPRGKIPGISYKK